MERTMSCEEINRHLGNKFRVIHNMIDKYFEKRCGRATYKLTRVQCATLHYLYDHREKNVFQKDIESEFCISGATATNILKGLERQKLIMREPMPEDARLKKIVLLESGVACHKQAYRNMIHMEETLAAGFSEEDLETLRNMLDHIIANLEGLQEIRCEKM